ncbi:MAG: NADPH-dependent glutamate synthase [Anaerolineae bacterium]|nr:NADPH-dependent glutamate synthase [Anaerolineae bacterium]MDW8101989.1 NADPH-dependent glutamate synthase [Anaerolineae bacterium]
MPAKEIIPRVEMPRQDPKIRRRNFDEVALGYDYEMALREASRCLQCKKPKCVEGCPVNIDIPGFIYHLREGNLEESIRVLKDKNNLPAICGRVCPQETQCEEVCVLSKKYQPVAIGRLERFVADWDIKRGFRVPEIPKPTGKRIAVVGSGPAGLTCAADLARLGHKVTIFESLHAPGGVLMYGIPQFRLPKEIVNVEVDYVKALGVEIELNCVVGKTLTLDEIFKEGYDAIFLGTGAGLPLFMGIPGENYNGVFSANEFLTRVNLMRAYRFPEYDTPIMVGKRVAVVGAGNVAMDASRSALRLGAEEVIIVYRRSREEMPARAEEIENAEAEGIEFMLLTNPVEILADSNGWVRGMRCIRMELGEPDESGRRRPIPIPGSEFEIEVDMVIMALGTRPNPLVFTDADRLQRTKHGTVVADPVTGKTTMPRVWAGGDVVTGAATVISAMGAAKRAAVDIHYYLINNETGWPQIKGG